MKYYLNSILWAVILLAVAGTSEVFSQQSAPMALGLNRIEGRVTDETGNGVNNAYVELYSNYGSLVGRQRSTGQGRFSFRGMGPGRYTISVKPFGTNLLEDTREIEINNQSSRSDIVVADFRLVVDKRFRGEEQLGIVGTVFAQEVPANAERLYRSGIDNAKSNPDRARADLAEAIKLFPNYFNALAALGKANVIAGKYETGYPYLLRAIDVNRKCGDCYYSLAIAFYKLNEPAAATKAIDAAVLLQPQLPVVRLLQGMIFRLNNDFTQAEKALLMARTLFKTPNAEVSWQLSIVYNRMKRNEEAAEELEKYMKAKSDINDAEKAKVRDLIAKLRNSK